MISPWNLFLESIRLFLKNFKYLLKFWLVNISLSALGFLPFLILLTMLIFVYGGKLSINQYPIIILGLAGVIEYVIMLAWLNSAGLVQAYSISLSTVPTIKQLLSQGWKLTWKVFVTSALEILAIVSGLILLVIPGLIFVIWFTFTISIVVAENLSGTAALSRSKQLVKGRFWKTVGYLLFPALIIFVYSFITSAVSAAIPKPSRSVFEILFSIVTWPFGLVSLIYSFLVYREFAK